MAPAKKTKSTAKPPRRRPVAPKAPKGSWENPLIPNARLQQIYADMLCAQMLEAKLAPASSRNAARRRPSPPLSLSICALKTLWYRLHRPIAF